MTRSGLAAAAAAVVALAAGCGGGSGLTHDAYVRRANAICATYDAAVTKLQPPRTLVEIEAYANRVLPLYRKALGALEQLSPPASDAGAARTWLAVDRRIERDLVALAAAARSRRIDRARAAVARARLDNARSNRLAGQLGANACARA